MIKCVALFLLAAPVFGSQVLFSNLGPGDSYGAGGWVANNSTQVALGFTVATTATLEEVDIPTFWNTSTNLGLPPNVSLLVEVLGPYPGGQQAPDASPNVLEFWTLTQNPANVPILHLLPSFVHPVLNSQQQYYVRISAAGLSSNFNWAWNLNNTGQVGWLSNVGGTWSQSNNTAPALRILGADAGTSSTPEPATSALLALGLLCAAARARAFSR